MIDYKNLFPPKAYNRIALCVVLFFYLLLCYNGVWNMALYPTEALNTETISSFLDACVMLTPATLIATSFGALSVLELVCTVPDNEWKTIMEMFLWSLLTILMNSFTAYLISTGNSSNMGIWLIFITTSVVNIVWYISMIILLKSSKRLHELAKKLEEDNNQNENVDMMESEIHGAKDLAYKLLKEIGCTPQETEEGRIKFEYKGIFFLMEAINDCMFVNLIWPWCHSFSKFDIDEFARVRQVVNGINMQGSFTVFYSFSDSDEVAVHIKKNFLFIPQIPDLDVFLRYVLDGFFRTARTLDLEIEKCRLQECER